MLKLVSFDFDGTLGDTMPLCLSTFRRAVQPYTKTILSRSVIATTFGLNERGMIAKILDTHVDEALQDFYQCYESEHHALCQGPFPGMRELLTFLRQHNILLSLITGKGEESCRISLRAFGLETLFDCVQTGSEHYMNKADLFRCLQKRYDLTPDQWVYIGDTVLDFEACQRAGVRCLSAAWAPGSAVEELEKRNPGNVMPSIDALRERLVSLM